MHEFKPRPQIHQLLTKAVEDKDWQLYDRLMNEWADGINQQINCKQKLPKVDPSRVISVCC
jgi:hypothetical protein